ncbi:MAG: general secretion pathway protein GspB [Thermodesulfovibrionales bacterium]
MSFILDQLKKSGKKRELELAMRSKAETQSRETAGASQTDFQPRSGHRIHMRGIYLLLFLAAASFSALGGFILLHGNPGSRQAPVVSTEALVHTAGPSVPKAESARPESVLPVDGGTFIPTKSSSKAGPEKIVSAPSVVRKMPDGKVESSMPVAAAELQNQPGSAAQGQIADPLPPEKSEPQDDAHRMPYLNELSASLKNALPPIRITSHLYRGDSRLVSINGKIMSEGVNMGEGLFLDEITPEGVILSFRGHRFRVRAD